jgi:hypothetical protein
MTSSRRQEQSDDGRIRPRGTRSVRNPTGTTTYNSLTVRGTNRSRAIHTFQTAWSPTATDNGLCTVPAFIALSCIQHRHKSDRVEHKTGSRENAVGVCVYVKWRKADSPSSPRYVSEIPEMRCYSDPGAGVICRRSRDR